MNQFLNAGPGSDEERNKIREILAQKGLVGVANDTKWSELIPVMKNKKGWQPQYRTKWIPAGFIGWWNAIWSHFPFSYMGVEWIDIWTIETQHVGMLLPPKKIDHSAWILENLKAIGLDYEQRGPIIRVWGYHPRSYEE